MADVMDMPPEPLPRDAERRKGGADDGGRRRDDSGNKDESRSSSRRDKEHSKRRKSASPPPPPMHRDRRHSPSRRSPGGHKRSRRDDDRDGRDGILGRGGYGWDYGRNRDWSARTAYGGDGGYGRREGILTYKQFIVELEDDILPAEAERRYEEYKAEYVASQKRTYFDQHKDEDWLRDKYDPARLETVLTRRIEVAKSSAREFHTELQGGSLDLGPAVPVSRSMFKDADAMSDDEKRKKISRLASDPPRAPAVASEPRRVTKDIEQAHLLMKKLDAEKGVEENVLKTAEQSGDGGSMVVIVRSGNQVKGLEGVELLDVLLTYLWRVHGVDYYGMLELRETPKGVRHVRTEEKATEENDAASTEWLKKLDSTWEARLKGLDPVEAMLGKEKLEASMTEVLEPLVRKIKDEKYGWKYGCGAKGCQKLFHGPEFVHKHLKLKHADLVSESISKVREELYFQNYMSDSNAPGMAATQSGQRENQKRRTPHGSSGRDRSPGRDYGRGSSYDGPGPSSTEPPVFDPFAAQAIPGPHPFGTEIPPPVLMPVPGAGPLGPFVPAPPDVTMRMWREHGGAPPPPFHAANSYDAAGYDGSGERGRKGGRGVLDAPHILPPPSGVRHDPRHMRSYHDLDAPEDEVTVIDYRSI